MCQSQNQNIVELTSTDVHVMTVETLVEHFNLVVVQVHDKRHMERGSGSLCSRPSH